eukprot:5987203-Pleurochrysis_carterae.AAC.3
MSYKPPSSNAAVATETQPLQPVSRRSNLACSHLKVHNYAQPRAPHLGHRRVVHSCDGTHISPSDLSDRRGRISRTYRPEGHSRLTKSMSGTSGLSRADALMDTLIVWH